MLLAVAPTALNAAAQTPPSFDFTQPSGRSGWAAQNDIASLLPSPDGLVVSISGPDPYLAGPPSQYPAGQPLWLRLRLRSDQVGSCQVFYYNTAPSEGASVRFPVPVAGQWVEGRVPVPALGAGYRVRIDPPGTGGTATLSSLRFESRGALPEFDLGTYPDATGWNGLHDMALGVPTPEGLPIQITGPDPYFFGPARDYPSDQPLWLNIRLRSEQAGSAQLFYFQTGPTEANSVRFAVPGGDWVDLRVPMPALGPSTRLRFDPPGTVGTCILSRIRFETRPVIHEPAWVSPVLPAPGAADPKVTSGATTVTHALSGVGAFEVRVAGTLMAVGNTRSMLGYVVPQGPRWLVLTNPATVLQSGESVSVTSTFADPDAGRWTYRQTFRPGPAPGLVDVETRVSADRDRRILMAPLFSLLPGMGSFGTNKTQGLMAGVEYLENEPSSSEADIIGPGARRKVPDAMKLTFPLMALSAGGRYVSLGWDPQPGIAAVHDSPDRTFGSGGHLMGLVFPGSDPSTREDGSLLPYDGSLLAAGETVVLHCTLGGGEGNTVIPAVQQYVALHPPPPAPSTGYSAVDYARLAAGGWLDSDIRDGFLFRHAVGASFTSGPAADAALYARWLSGQVGDVALSNRLADLAQGAIAAVAPSSYNFSGVGHVRLPVASLVFGHITENVATARGAGKGQVGLFRPDGTMVYMPPAGGPDLGTTQPSREANGLAAPHVASVLEDAALSGDAALLAEGFRLLRALGKFRETVPRGAQTWEVPLHTPDILASAYLVRAYTLGYELSGDPEYLEQARYWAWTGVPFVYLAPPGPKVVGVYGTIPVLGATLWVAPNWIGLPVQWCGLVYGNAIRRMARHDPGGPWIRLADGIAAAGLQMTHTAAEPRYQGLLPDSFDLRNQIRNPVPINPATLLPEALALFGFPPVYDFRAFVHHGVQAHAPGPMTGLEETADVIRFTVESWSSGAWRVLLTGFTAAPRVRINDVEVPLNGVHQFVPDQGLLMLRLTGRSRIEVLQRARDALRIEKTVDPGQVRVLWPQALNGAWLEAGDALGVSTMWSSVGATPVRAGQEMSVTLNTRGPAVFFRLRRSGP